MKLVTLDKWAALHYDPPPPLTTVQRWARTGQIYPAPVRHGRAYRVQADARHIAQTMADMRGGR